MQLVGCPPNLGCGGFGTITSHFFLLLLGSEATQTVQSHWGERQLHVTLTPAHRGCYWKPITALLIFDQSRHDNAFCSSRSISVLASLECLCTSSPVDVCLWFPYLCYCICFGAVNHKLIGFDTLLSSSHITLLQKCFSLCLSFPCAMKQKLSLEWLDISLFTLCPLPFLLSLWKKVLSWVFYLLIYLTFWVVWMLV